MKKQKERNQILKGKKEKRQQGNFSKLLNRISMAQRDIKKSVEQKSNVISFG